MRRNHNRRRLGRARSADARLHKLQNRKIGLPDERQHQGRPDRCMQGKRKQRVQREWQSLVFSVDNTDLGLQWTKRKYSKPNTEVRINALSVITRPISNNKPRS